MNRLFEASVVLSVSIESLYGHYWQARDVILFLIEIRNDIADDWFTVLIDAAVHSAMAIMKNQTVPSDFVWKSGGMF
jgi:hypothetical protein